MLVAIGPWMTRSSTGIASAPKLSTISLPGIGRPVLRRQGRAEDAEPHHGQELAQRAGGVELPARHPPADEAGVVGRVGEPGDPPADADGSHDRGHGAPPRAAGEDRAGRPRVAPVDVEEEPRHHRHGDEHDDRRGDRPLLEGGDGVVSEPRDADLDGHDDQATRIFAPVVLRRGVHDPQLAQQGHDEVEDDPRVDRAPADGEAAPGSSPARRRRAGRTRHGTAPCR